jgi:hypothetical protein
MAEKDATPNQGLHELKQSLERMREKLDFLRGSL